VFFPKEPQRIQAEPMDVEEQPEVKFKNWILDNF